MGGRQRRRQAKAKAAKMAIVAANVQALGHGKATIGKVAQVRCDVTSLKASTHTGVRTPLHEGGHVRVIAHKGFSLGRPQGGRMFGKVAPPKAFRTTAPKSKRFALDDYV